ncbi:MULTISPECIES: LysR family transcriptional regulator [Bacillus amyloliquefaciens group]|uniref:LysR family transcriptional regulator n=1 Tax=Bacillus amyloliquefaciens group TaxID=1938374 RepID=UPI0007A5D753|nr:MULTISPECIES: LysR family transcriptional regulator [Bacillus amyloliquefaciens group]MCV3200725.1 LysR family transcriptional regulator [Bacillus velezensis]MDP1503892.1 LysR family transcriptional regulator [Bacillus velezensis]MDP1507751.1 LysR family transcriptional regulator [Bacillus velezensis]MDW0357111.1 LysR family transcriptional regulator [Bacillus velezensis]MEE1864243.1 LysR family transcriptional regulator [Bacillus velezensis]
MEWEQLEYFQTLARIQHVTKAAEKLSITQPALSRSIVRLENHLGVPLFDRQGRSIKLNKYGEIFLKRVESMIQEYTEGKEEIQSLLKPDQGEVSLGFLHTLGTTIVPNLIGTFKDHYPKVQFQLNQSHSNLLLDKLKSGELDLCLLASFPAESNIMWKPLWKEELFLFLPKNHVLAARGDITLNEIANEPFVLMKEGFALRVTLDHIFEQVHITPNIVFEGEEATTIAGFVAAGLGVSILPDFKGLDQTNIAKVRISWPRFERTIGISWIEGKYLSPVTKNFKQYIINQFPQIDTI